MSFKGLFEVFSLSFWHLASNLLLYITKHRNYGKQKVSKNNKVNFMKKI